MAKYLPFIFLLGTSCWLSYLKEIDRLERDYDPRRDGRRFFLIGFSSLLLTLLFTFWSADAGMIMLTLTLYLVVLLLGILAGQRIALAVYRRRNPDLFTEEE